VTGSLSREARRFLASLPPMAERPLPPQPEDLDGWAAFRERVEQRVSERDREWLAQAQVEYGVTIDAPFDNRCTLRLRTGNSKDRPAIIYLHGGGYTCFSPRSSLRATLPLAAALDTTVISVDYLKAPHHRFRQVVERCSQEVSRYLGPGTALVGDSAGGGLALAVTLRLAALGQPLPQALALWSPWVDLDDWDDSVDDPIVRYQGDLAHAASCYAPGADAEHPLASPVRANWPASFPPVLLQSGAREGLRRSIRRLARRLQEAGITCQHAEVPGLFHSFPSLAPLLPESVNAMSQVRTFLAKHSPVPP